MGLGIYLLRVVRETYFNLFSKDDPLNVSSKEGFHHFVLETTPKNERSCCQAFFFFLDSHYTFSLS